MIRPGAVCHRSNNGVILYAQGYGGPCIHAQIGRKHDGRRLTDRLFSQIAAGLMPSLDNDPS